MINNVIRDRSSRDFAYDQSAAGIRAICKHVRENCHGYVQGGYDFLEEPGERVQLNALLELAAPGDRVYVTTLKVFLFGDFQVLCSNLQIFEERGIQVISLDEPEYDFSAYRGALNLASSFLRLAVRRQKTLEDMLADAERLCDELRSRVEKPQEEVTVIQALTLYHTSRFTDEEVCQFTGLSRAHLHRALAEDFDVKKTENKESQDE